MIAPSVFLPIILILFTTSCIISSGVDAPAEIPTDLQFSNISVFKSDAEVT